ncbi:MAG TPA: helicase-related protein, partial [Candidatus Thermoplasmatota archaeon]
LVFVNTRRTAEVLAARLGFWGRDEIGVHHGSLSKDVRVEAEESFKSGRLRGLICTSSMELGIDVGTADYVVQVNSPREARRLVQRVGRAGHRLGLVSRGVIVAETADDALEAAVIARRALAETIEPPRIPEAPLDVLANQLVAMLLQGDMTQDEALALLRRSHPFRALDATTFVRVVRLLEGTRLVHAGPERLGRRARARAHHVENLSMIPDAATFVVLNAVTRRPVGTLDEAFVVTYVEPGASFIFQGQTWRVVEVREDRSILVAPVHDPTGAVPSWVGEEIPVPFDVAQEVGRVRQGLSDALAAGDDGAAWLERRYPIGPEAAALAVQQIRDQHPGAVPTHDVATFEAGRGVVVINACLGSRGNEALGHAVAALVTARTGRTVGLEVDPYRIVLELPPQVPARRVHDVLDDLQRIPPGGLGPLLASLLANAPILRFKLVHVARKFGVLERRIDATRVNVARLLNSFRGTPLYEEAVSKVLRERMDVVVAEGFLQDLASGRVRLVGQVLSSIGKAGLDQGAGLVPPSRATGALLDALRRRLLDEEVVLACLHCREWTAKRRVERVELPLSCPLCHAKQATVVRPWHTRSLRLVKKKGPRSREETHDVRRLHTAA